MYFLAIQQRNCLNSSRMLLSATAYILLCILFHSKWGTLPNKIRFWRHHLYACSICVLNELSDFVPLHNF